MYMEFHIMPCIVLGMIRVQKELKDYTGFVLLCSDNDFDPGGGGTPLHKPYRNVPPHRVGFLPRFGLKTGLHFAHFGLELGMVFEGTTRVYERIYRFNFK